MPDTQSALDAALAAHSAAWVAIAVTDSQGDEEAEFAVLTPDGQRGFVTRGILIDALDAVRIQPGE